MGQKITFSDYEYLVDESECGFLRLAGGQELCGFTIHSEDSA